MSHFAETFKRVRLESRQTQEDLANVLHIKVRTVTSWETGDRLPSAGMVFLLCLLFSKKQLRLDPLLSHELMIAYLLDDLHRQSEIHTEGEFHHLLEQGAMLLQQIADERQGAEMVSPPASLLVESQETYTQSQPQPSSLASPQGHDEMAGKTLDQMATLFEHLRRHPEFLPIANDFLGELASSPQ